MPKNLWRLVRGKRRIGEAVQAHGYDGGSEEGEVNHWIDASVTAESVGALVSKRSKSAAGVAYHDIRYAEAMIRSLGLKHKGDAPNCSAINEL